MIKIIEHHTVGTHQDVKGATIKLGSIKNKVPKYGFPSFFVM